MFKIPAHKQTDPDKAPGQRSNPVPSQDELRTQNGDVTLGDYIARKTPPPVKTYDEGYTDGYDDGLAEGWQRGFLFAKKGK
jgi:hypothetical protein